MPLLLLLRQSFQCCGGGCRRSLLLLLLLLLALVVVAVAQLSLLRGHLPWEEEVPSPLGAWTGDGPRCWQEGGGGEGLPRRLRERLWRWRLAALALQGQARLTVVRCGGRKQVELRPRKRQRLQLRLQLRQPRRTGDGGLPPPPRRTWGGGPPGSGQACEGKCEGGVNGGNVEDIIENKCE